MPLTKSTKKYTYQDYIKWPDDVKTEIINGEFYDMTPAPKIKHQKISRNLTWKFGKQVEKLKNCEFYEAPTDVVFDEYNVVQPDIFIVCDNTKITEDNIKGAPDLIVEIVSKSTELKDKREKKNLYEKFKVKEYIIVYPERDYIERFCLEDNKYLAPDIFNWDEKMKLETFDIEINLWEIFEKKLEEREKPNLPKEK